jgi:hypothetical protein
MYEAFEGASDGVTKEIVHPEASSLSATFTVLRSTTAGASLAKAAPGADISSPIAREPVRVSRLKAFIGESLRLLTVVTEPILTEWHAPKGSESCVSKEKVVNLGIYCQFWVKRTAPYCTLPDQHRVFTVSMVMGGQ